MPKIIDMQGWMCGELAVIEFDSIGPGNDRQARWKCRCSCGEEVVVSGRDLRSGNSKTCGSCRFPHWRSKPRLSDNRVCVTCKQEKSISDFDYSRQKNTYKLCCASCEADRIGKIRKIKEGHIDKQKMINVELRSAALKEYGGKCVCCGEGNSVFLAFDHINGGGNKHKGERNRKKVSTIAHWLKDNEYPKDFQILCNNCNWAKHANKLCPHQIDSSVALLSFGG